MLRRICGIAICFSLIMIVFLAIEVDRRILASSMHGYGEIDYESLREALPGNFLSMKEQAALKRFLFETQPDELISESGYNVEPLLELSRSYKPPASNVTAAVCLKTIFGHDRPDLMNHVLSWVAYNRLLGFDEILVWYAKEHIPPAFDRLLTLPYVKLVENKRNPMLSSPNDYEINKENGGGQLEDIEECMKLTKGNYDWVFIADWDEYLWFSEKIRLKEFLMKHRDKTWLSFGKWMYEHKEVVPTNKNLFGLEKRPFTFKTYCYASRGKKICPNWVGRSKVLFRRAAHSQVRIHGGKEPNARKGIVHFDTDVAHIKEWRGYFNPVNETVRENKSYKVPADEHEVYEMDDGNYTVHYDKDLQGWLDFIADIRR